MSLIKTIYQLWRKNTLKFTSTDFSDTTPLGWNLYGNEFRGEARKEFYKVNLTFKNKFFRPIVLIAERILKGTLDKPIPHEPYNRNIEVFDLAYDKSVDEWTQYYLPHKIGYKYTDKVKDHTKTKNFLGLCKKLMLKFILNDSAYRELFNIFAHNFTQGMIKEYEGQEVKHLFYTSLLFDDASYYVMQPVIAKVPGKQLEAQTWSFKFNNVGGQKR